MPTAQDDFGERAPDSFEDRPLDAPISPERMARFTADDDEVDAWTAAFDEAGKDDDNDKPISSPTAPPERTD